MKETFVGEPILPVDTSFFPESMALGEPGLPQRFCWQGREFTIVTVLDKWKEAGDCRHGSGERYVRKHWYRVQTSQQLEMKIYFERQRRTRGGSRWRLYSMLSEK